MKRLFGTAWPTLSHQIPFPADIFLKAARKPAILRIKRAKQKRLEKG
jgi:hypothetical protein